MAIYINNSYAFCLLKVVVSNVSVHAKWIHYFLKIMVCGGPLNPLNMCVLEVSLMKKRMPLHGVFYSRCMFILCFSTQNPFYQNLSTSLKIPEDYLFFWLFNHSYMRIFCPKNSPFGFFIFPKSYIFPMQKCFGNLALPPFLCNNPSEILHFFFSNPLFSFLFPYLSNSGRSCLDDCMHMERMTCT